MKFEIHYRYTIIESAARLAIDYRDFEMLQAALDLGADPNTLPASVDARDEFGGTLIDYARWRGWLEAISFMSGLH